MTSGMPELGELSQMTEQLRQFGADTQRRAAQFQQVGDRLAETTVSEQGQQGAIRVTVASTGALRELQLTEQARELPAARLAAEILGCVQRAQAGIAEQARQLVAETVQDDSPQAAAIAADIVDTFRQNFPPPPPSGVAPEEQAPDVGGLAEQDEADLPGPQDDEPRRDDDQGPGSFLR